MASAAPTAPPTQPAVAGPGAPPPRANVPLLALLTVAHAIVDTYATTVPALMPLWQSRFGLTYGLSGLVTGIANVTSSVAQPLVGVLTDRGRDTRWLALACLLAAAGVGATGLVASYPLFLALVAIGGLGVSAFHPQGYKLTGLHAGPNQAAATSWFLVGGNVGVALGPLLGTALAARFGPPATVVLFWPGLAFAAALWWLVPRLTRPTRPGTPQATQQAAPQIATRDSVAGRRDGPAGPVAPLQAWPAGPERRRGEHAAGAEGVGAERSEGEPAEEPALTAPSLRSGQALSGATGRLPNGSAVAPPTARLGGRRRGAAVAVLVAVVALRSAVSSSLVSFVPLYYVRIVGAGEATASRVLAGMLLGGALATLGGGYAADRWGRLGVLAGTLAAVPPLLLWFVAAEPGSAAAVAALWAAGAMVAASFSITVVLAQELWHERRALASGVIVGLAFGLGGLLVPVVGAAADQWGLTAALRLLAAVPVATLALVAALALLLSPKSDV
jgi:MFS family permease